MQNTRIGLSSIKRPLPNEKLPIMHVIGNYLEQCHGRKTVLIRAVLIWIPGSSGVILGSQRFTCRDALPVRPHDCSGAGGEKKKISKLRGKRKTRYKNPVFPAISDFEFGDFTAFLKHLPSRHPGCECISGWSPDIHGLTLSEQSAGFGFFGAVPWRRYA